MLDISPLLSLLQFTALCTLPSRSVFSHAKLSLKGLSHEIFGPVFWPVWMYLGLNVKRLRFLNFDAAPLVLDN
jgi:hypothetical protein